jgi:eukaryotic-like serine/threonine-protein kinase
MSDDRWRLIEDLFQRAADLPIAERPRFIAACGGDEELRHQVESLLAHEESRNDVLAAAISRAVG